MHKQFISDDVTRWVQNQNLTIRLEWSAFAFFPCTTWQRTTPFQNADCSLVSPWPVRDDLHPHPPLSLAQAGYVYHFCDNQIGLQTLCSNHFAACQQRAWT